MKVDEQDLSTLGRLLALRPGAWPVYGGVPAALLGGLGVYNVLRLLSPILGLWIRNPYVRRRLATLGGLGAALPLLALGYMSGNPIARVSPYVLYGD